FTAQLGQAGPVHALDRDVYWSPGHEHEQIGQQPAHAGPEVAADPRGLTGAGVAKSAAPHAPGADPNNLGVGDRLENVGGGAGAAEGLEAGPLNPAGRPQQDVVAAL